MRVHLTYLERSFKIGGDIDDQLPDMALLSHVSKGLKRVAEGKVTAA
jgi:hypothetical protein